MLWVLIFAWGNFVWGEGVTDFGKEVVIDVHSHVFNAKYLPVCGIAEARGVPRPVASILSKLVLALTPLSDFKKAEAEEALEGVKSLSQSEAYEEVVTRLNSVQLSKKEERELRAFFEEDSRSKGLVEPAGEMERGELVLKLFRRYEILVDGEHLSAKGGEAMLERSLAKFLFTLMSSELGIAGLAERDFPETDLFVHHMMDMEKAYADRPHCVFSKQIDRMRDFDRVKAGAFLNFVAFDPFRRDADLAYVKRAWEKGGSVGVKFYPPSGYRPAGNEIPKFEGKTGAQRRQWDSRYGGLSNEELDGYCAELFAYCAGEGIPIFVHCTDEGFQAVEGYGKLSEPRFWVPVLEKHADLNLCFGHAGGYDDWYAAELDWLERVDEPLTKEVGFEEQVFRLSVKYANVYLEFGYHENLADAEKRGNFVSNVEALIRGAKEQGLAPFESKLLFGTDWHMSSMLRDSSALYAGASAAFSGEVLSPYRKAFFAGNAARYLRLGALVEAADSRFSEAQLKRWASLLAALD